MHRPQRRKNRLLCLLSTLALLAPGFDVWAAAGDKPAAAQSPYFEISDDSGVDHFPLKETHVTAEINGVIASVHVHQRYRNEGTKALNAKYIFPGSMGAAVNGMTMTIGDRRIRAQIREKEQANRMFEAAKAAGQTASLLAQKRPNVFSMDVANIAAGSEVQVELDYTEFLTATDGEYQFVYPGVVGPRYGGDAERSDLPTAWVSNPYLHSGLQSPTAFDISVAVNSPIPLHDLRCDTHKIITRWNGANSGSIALDESPQSAGNRDFILHYRLQGDAVITGLTQYSAGGEHYFMLQAEPPQRAVALEPPARDYVFILDVSGSMSGFPLDTARSLIRKLLASLRPRDRFNILLFAGDSSVLAPESLAATPENIARAQELLRQTSGGGGTELLPALQLALAMPLSEDTSRSLVLITDGYVSAEDSAFKLVDESLGSSNLYAFGIGTAVNRFLIEGLAKVGRAESFVVTNEADAAREAERFRDYVSAPVMTSISVAGHGVELYDTEPRTQPDLLARRPVLVLGKYRHAQADAAVELTGVTGTGRQQWSFALAGSGRDSSLPVLWARKRLERLYVFPNAPQESRDEILALGLKYSLLTSATSFISVDERLPTGDGEPAVDVKQPQPLPEGVGDKAVGESLTPAPEPDWAVLVAWCALLLGLRPLRKFYRVRAGG
ncbi:MAG TPA: VIT domain-containing protein [Steroidobacteraceae bacterium]|nr:VIT domain-containing protein [Steroidobacteraceae bacterium]